MSDHKGAFLLFSALARAIELLAEKGYDSDWFRAALATRGRHLLYVACRRARDRLMVRPIWPGSEFLNALRVSHDRF